MALVLCQLPADIRAMPKDDLYWLFAKHNANQEIQNKLAKRARHGK